MLLLKVVIANYANGTDSESKYCHSEFLWLLWNLLDFYEIYIMWEHYHAGWRVTKINYYRSGIEISTRKSQHFDDLWLHTTLTFARLSTAFVSRRNIHIRRRSTCQKSLPTKNYGHWLCNISIHQQKIIKNLPMLENDLQFFSSPSHKKEESATFRYLLNRTLRTTQI